MNTILLKEKLLSAKVLLFVAAIFAIQSSIITSLDGGDFDVYLDAAQKMQTHMNIYVPPFIKDLQYYYSPFFAWILIPFSKYVFVTELAWSLISYLLLFRTFKLMQHYFDFTRITSKQYTIWILLTVLFSVQFILYNVAMIQITFFLLWAIFEAMNQIFKGKFISGGALLGLVINIKIMPVLILPFLFYRGYFKALCMALLTFLILLFLPVITIGYEYNMFLLAEWWKIINPANKEHLFEAGIGTHSLVSLLPVYLTETVGEMPYPRNIFNLGPHTVEVIINVSRLFILALSLIYFKSLPFKKELYRLKSFWELSYFVLIIPLLLPHQQKYAFLFAIPMISYLLYFFIRTYAYQKTTLYYIMLYTFAVCLLFYSPLYGSDVIGRFLFDVTQHYRFLTFATLLFIPVSMYCSPLRLDKAGLHNTEV